MNDLAKFFIVFAILVVITACSFATRDSASTIEVRLYGDGQLNRGYMAWNSSGRGEIWFSSRDGEKFSGEYTTIAPEVYSQDLSVLIGRVGRTRIVTSRPSFSSATSNVQYGLASAVGDRGTTVACKYVAMVSLWTWGFTATGSCLDSKGKNYTAHASSSDSGSPNLAKEEIQTSSNTGLDNPPALPPVQSRAPEPT